MLGQMLPCQPSLEAHDWRCGDSNASPDVTTCGLNAGRYHITPVYLYLLRSALGYRW